MLKKIAGINLIILLVYTVLSTVAGLQETGQYRMLGGIILMAMAIAFHAGILFLLSLIFFAQRNKPKGRAFLLSALLVLLVGFSACFGITSLA